MIQLHTEGNPLRLRRGVCLVVETRVISHGFESSKLWVFPIFCAFCLDVRTLTVCQQQIGVSMKPLKVIHCSPGSRFRHRIFAARLSPKSLGPGLLECGWIRPFAKVARPLRPKKVDGTTPFMSSEAEPRALFSGPA